MAAKKRTKKAAPPPADPREPAPPTGKPGGPEEPATARSDAPSAETPEPRFPVVGIGASAGGLEALTQLLQAMSPDSGMAFVFVSHLDPEHKSALGEILSRVTAMPVREADDGLAIEPNHVYVMPPNRDMILRRGALRLTPRVATHLPQMPVDTFLRSLARDRANGAIGVVLSGTGTDGTLGLKEIREAGGFAFAQDETAAFGGMPRSAVAAGVVDAALPPAKIAAELLRISKQPLVLPVPEAAAPEGGPGEEAFYQILRLLSATTGVDVVHYKHSTLRRRIERRMVLRGLKTLGEYLECLRDDVAEQKRLFEEVLIPVTSFFRDPETFEALKTSVLPRLMARRPAQAPFRVWVPGCATGEEAYSIAICLLEYLAATESPLPIKIFATDVSERAIEAARTGVYGEGIATEVSAERLQRYFLKTDRGFEVSKAVRDLCVFARQDVTKDPPFSQLDLVTCRNVLIYLGSVLQDHVLPILHYALHPGGVLVLGSSETVGRYTDLFEAIDKKRKFYQRTATPSRLTFEYTPRTPARAPMVREGPAEHGRGLPDVYREADRVVLADYAPTGVLLDENFRILQYRGDTGNFLKPAPGPPTTELLLMVREGLLGDLHETLHRAWRENAPARKEGVRVKTNDHFTDIDLHVIPIADPVSAVRYFVVLFADRAEAAVPRPRKPPTPEEESEKDREISRLNHDLTATKAYLQSLIEQKEASNEELRASNEEVVSANEELQSTNEELTTAKEELQATNEELTTVNDELQSRVRTTNELADDLVNLIETTRIPIVVLGPDLCVRRFTPAARTVMNLRPGDVGRPFLELKTKINVPDLEPLVQEVIDTLEIKQREVADESGAWHKLYVRPYKTLDHKLGGVVLMLIDIDVLKRREQEIEESRDYAVSIVETVREPLLVLDGELRVRTCNRAFYEGFHVSPADTEGRLIYELGGGEWDIPRLRTLLEEILPQNHHLENFEVEHDFPGIGRRTIFLNAHRLVQGKENREQLILLAIEDATARKRAERLRKETEDRLRSMVDTAVDAIITIDARGTINSLNAATERMFGYQAGEMIGQNVRMLMPPPYRDEHDGYLTHYQQTGERHIIGIGREVHGRRKNGSVFPADLAVSEFEDQGRRMFTGVLRDLSARKDLEREVLEVATMEQQRIGQELHDTSAQELTALGLLADSLVGTMNEGPPAESRIATKIAEGLRRVLGQVRTISRGLIRVEVDAEGLMAALTELAAQTTELRGVTCTFDCKQPVRVADNHTATQLYSIAREAVTNALKHAQARNITIHLEGDDQSVTLRVRDDGVGLPKPPLDTKGMGLKIMRYRAGLIDAHLSVGPADGSGTVVVCTCNKGAPYGRS
ncbi:MAG TPA: chemotaxis protein CheB [Pirellulales bacterium]|nr:chemotaxis protein CheB [Pirellulales bacterium]